MDETTPDDTTRQPSLPIGRVEDPDGQVELLDPGPRAEAADDDPTPRDDRTLPMWDPLGHAPGASWRRRGVPEYRGDLEARQLVLAVEAVDTHAGHTRRNGRPWRGGDTNTMLEFSACCWNYADCDRMAYRPIPSWLTEWAERHATQATDGRTFVKLCWLPFLGLLVSAYRAGTLGCELSLEEIVGLRLAGSRRTAARYVRAMEELGLIKVLRIWTDDNGSRARERRRNVYQIGPAIEGEVGPGILDKTSDATRGKLRAETAKRCAHAALARAAKGRAAAKRRAWEAQDRRRRAADPDRRPPGMSRKDHQEAQERARRDRHRDAQRPQTPPQGAAARPSGSDSDRGSAVLPPHPSLRSGLNAAPEQGAGFGAAARPDGGPALQGAPPPPAGERAGDGDTRARPGASSARGGGPGGGASDVPFPGVDLASIAPRLAGGFTAATRGSLGMNVTRCRGCQGRGSVPLPGGTSRRECVRCRGTGDEPAPPDPRPDPPGQARLFGSG